MRELSSRCVAVHTHDSCRREQLSQFLFELFCARAKVFDVTAAAFRAGLGHGHTQVAVMTKECAVCVVDERQPTRCAGDRCAAGAAHDKRGVTTSIQHDDRLFAARKRLGKKLTQRRRDDRSPPAPQLLAHIDGTDVRQRLTADPLRHCEKRQLSRLGPRIGLERGGRTAEHEECAVTTRQHFRDHARMIARCLVLLVRHILFLIEDDGTDIICGCEECGARTDDDARLPTPYTENRIVALCE